MSNNTADVVEWISKQEAAKMLGVSLKSVQKYVGQGKLSAKYERGKTGDAMFIPKAEVERMKEIHRLTTFRPAIPFPTITESVPTTVPVQATPPAALVPDIVVESLGRFLTMASIPSKLLLTIEEAAAVSGLPKSYLRSAITEKRLPAVNVSRRWLIKRVELEAFVEGL